MAGGDDDVRQIVGGDIWTRESRAKMSTESTASVVAKRVVPEGTFTCGETCAPAERILACLSSASRLAVPCLHARLPSASGAVPGWWACHTPSQTLLWDATSRTRQLHRLTYLHGIAGRHAGALTDGARRRAVRLLPGASGTVQHGRVALGRTGGCQRRGGARPAHRHAFHFAVRRAIAPAAQRR